MDIVGASANRPATLTERSTFRKGWAAARLLIKAAPAAGSSAPSSAAPAPAAKRVKLSSLVDVTAEAELNPLAPEAVRDMFERYSLARGEPPAPDIEPTGEQLGVVKQLVDSGAPPYVDFALFGPHGRRLLKKLTYTESCFNPSTGDWSNRELPGPADIAGWMRSRAVFECTLLLFGLGKAERLRNCFDRIPNFCPLYGQHCWPIIYQADCRMRCEHFEKLRRQLESQHSSEVGWLLQPAQPRKRIRFVRACMRARTRREEAVVYVKPPDLVLLLLLLLLLLCVPVRARGYGHGH